MHCVVCTGDLDFDHDVDSYDESRFDAAYTAGYLAADLNKDWWLTYADQDLFAAAKVTNSCTCNPDVVANAYQHLDNSVPSWKYVGQQFNVDLEYRSTLPIARLVPVVVRQGESTCDATVIWDDGYGGPSIAGTDDGGGTYAVTVSWRAYATAPGIYELGLLDTGTGRMIAEDLVDLDVRRRSGGGGRTHYRFTQVEEIQPR